MNAIIYPCNEEGAESKKEDIWAWLYFGFIKYVLSMLTSVREKLWNDLLCPHIHKSLQSFYWLNNIKWKDMNEENQIDNYNVVCCMTETSIRP